MEEIFDVFDSPSHSPTHHTSFPVWHPLSCTVLPLKCGRDCDMFDRSCHQVTLVCWRDARDGMLPRHRQRAVRKVLVDRRENNASRDWQGNPNSSLERLESHSSSTLYNKLKKFPKCIFKIKIVYNNTVIASSLSKAFIVICTWIRHSFSFRLTCLKKIY